MKSTRLLLACALGLGLRATFAPLRADVQKDYVATTNSSIVWLEEQFDATAKSEGASEVPPALSYFAGFTHPGKKYVTPTRTFFGIARKTETTNPRNGLRNRRFAKATQMVVTIKGARTQFACSYTDDRERNGETVIITEKMVADVNIDVLKQLSNAPKASIGFLSSGGDFLGEYNIGKSDLKALDGLMDRIPKRDR